MKKFLALLLTVAMVFAMAACSAPAAEETKPAEEGTAAPAEETSDKPAAAGSVYYLNFKPEADAAWQELAKKYTELTGVPVKVVTAASGDYQTTLTSEMDKSEAPTLFQCGNQGALNTWGEYCLDLKDTDFYKEMTTDDFNLFGENGEVLAAGYCYEAFGIIVNKALLEKAGHSIDEITNFETLKAVADDIHARAAELGFDAFSSAGLDGSSAWRFSGHLANMPLFYEFRDDNVTAQPAAITGKYLDNYKAIWDLYTTDTATTGADLITATGDMSSGEFKEGKAAFYQNGTWAYGDITGNEVADEDLGMLPIYIGAEGEENQGLCTGSENYWCVNSKAPEEDIQATLDFLNWVVTSDEGRNSLAKEMGFTTPFDTFTEEYVADNPLLDAANAYIDAGKTSVAWCFTTMPSENWKNGVGSALLEYAQGTGEWDGVVSAFVDGWATEYAATAAE